MISFIASVRASFCVRPTTSTSSRAGYTVPKVLLRHAGIMLSLGPACLLLLTDCLCRMACPNPSIRTALLSPFAHCEQARATSASTAWQLQVCTDDVSTSRATHTYEGSAYVNTGHSRH